MNTSTAPALPSATPATEIAAAAAKRTTVSITLSPQAFAHFEKAAAAEHRSLPNYLFVKLQHAYEHEQASKGLAQGVGQNTGPV